MCGACAKRDKITIVGFDKFYAKNDKTNMKPIQTKQEHHALFRAAILAINGAMPSAVYGIADVFTSAGILWGEVGVDDLAHISIVTASDKPVRGLGGVPLMPNRSFAEVREHIDMLFIPPIFGSVEAMLQDHSGIQAITACIEAGVQVCTVCAGAFWAAETGLFDGRRATTHWNLIRLFRERYPLVKVDPTAMLIDGGDYICAGGVTAYLDLCLHILAKRISSDFSARCARMLLVDGERRTQAPYMAYEEQTTHDDAVVARVQDYVRTRLNQPIDVNALAEAAEVGLRTLERRFRTVLGMTPKRYLIEKRLDAAKLLLSATQLDIGQVALHVGYDDAASFSRLFKKNVEVTPGEYRKRFAR